MLPGLAGTLPGLWAQASPRQAPGADPGEVAGEASIVLAVPAHAARRVPGNRRAFALLPNALPAPMP